MSIPNKASPAITSMTQADSAHNASVERFMAEQTAALWTRHSLGAHSWAWVDYLVAPKANVNDVTTWRTFNYYPTTPGGPSSYTARHPWYFPSAYATGVEFVIYYVAPISSPFKVRVGVSDVVDTYPDCWTQSSPSSTESPAFDIPNQRWEALAGSYRMYKTMLTMYPDSGITAVGDRWGIQVQAKCSAREWAYTTSSVQMSLYLIALCARNIREVSDV